MIPEIGHFSLILAFCMSIVLSSTALWPLRPWARSMVLSPKQFQSRILLSYLQAFLLTLGFLSLMLSFINCDFSVQYVAENAHTGLPWYYRAFALWGNHEGSLLLWIWVQSIWMIYVIRTSQHWPLELRQGTLGILSLLISSFLFLLLAFSNPFLRWLPNFPEQGQDLNPLLQDLGFILHPPILYIGYVGFSIPFALTLTSLYLRLAVTTWALLVRPFVFIPWAFLTLGITLGSWWAYYELGWGGFWFWDPVENASFLPWLLGVALIHSLMATSKGALFAQWSMLLAISTFLLSLLGTFLVRSGVLTSVHAFAVDPERGLVILLSLATMIAISYILFFKYRSPGVHAKFRLFSIESALLFNNLLITVAMASILLGTLYPLILDSLDLAKISVGPPYFNAVFIPIALLLLLLMSMAPKISWTAISFSAVLVGIIALKYYLGSRLSLMSCLAVGLSSLLITQALGFLRQKKWGMILAHIGVAVVSIGISLTSDLSQEHDLALKVGQSVKIDGYDFHLKQFQTIHGGNYEGVRAQFMVTSPSGKEQYLYPEKRFFSARQIPMTETAIDPGFFRDLYIALGEQLSENEWSLRIYVKPFVRWLWIGGLLIMFGGIVAQQKRKIV